MKEQYIKFKMWWAELALREKQALIVGFIASTLFLMYQWAWSPLMTLKDDLHEQIVAASKTYSWMQKADLQIDEVQTSAQKQNAALTPVMLLGLLQQRINQAGLAPSLSQLKQAHDDSLEIHFQKVEFDKLMSWFLVFAKEEPIQVTQMSVVAANEPGLVNVDMIVGL
ncbi:MAG: type II secretion system protein M [Gammaproteobacteria bacterium]|nr:type II secretion system protein M [Gammaproteobacteria bacterium]